MLIMKITDDMSSIEISNVSSYLSYIESKRHDNKKWFFRGEDRDYGKNKLMPSLYRRYVYYNSSDGMYNDALKEYERVARDFYSELNSISQTDQMNFMAFCQHHSIPTPLLDATTSPLVSLYFAAQNPGTNKDGKIYMFDPSHFIYKNNSFLKYGEDLSQFQYMGNNYNYLSSDIQDFVVGNKEKNKYFVDTIIPDTLKDFKNYVGLCSEDYRQRLENNYPVMFRATTYDEVANSLRKGSSDISSDDPDLMGRNYIEYLKSMGIIKGENGFYKDDKLLMGGSFGVTGYSDIFGFIIWILRLTINGEHGFFQPRKLQFYTTTSKKWDRVKAQSGIFLVILPEGHEFKYESNKIKFKCNPPKPDYEITIPFKHKKNILDELDSMEINEKNLFLDIDHTANYIVSNHFNR